MLITPAADAWLRAAGIEAGAEEAIGLPVEDAELAARLRALLARRCRDIELTDRARWLAARHAESHAELASRDMQVLAHLLGCGTALTADRFPRCAGLNTRDHRAAHGHVARGAGNHPRRGRTAPGQGRPADYPRKRACSTTNRPDAHHVHHGYAILRYGTRRWSRRRLKSR
jgi:hypothetical protein